MPLQIRVEKPRVTEVWLEEDEDEPGAICLMASLDCDKRTLLTLSPRGIELYGYCHEMGIACDETKDNRVKVL